MGLHLTSMIELYLEKTERFCILAEKIVVILLNHTKTPDTVLIFIESSLSRAQGYRTRLFELEYRVQKYLENSDDLSTDVNKVDLQKIIPRISANRLFLGQFVTVLENYQALFTNPSQTENNDAGIGLKVALKKFRKMAKQKTEQRGDDLSPLCSFLPQEKAGMTGP